ncbi:MAG: MXAN_6521/LA_1396 family lipoprotein [Leptospiraceae bacterium]|nr:MXAN_6521/LA_1396 family lipoprotein [Leptospiraceae bacterium]
MKSNYNLFFVLSVIFIFANCTVKYVKKAPNWKEEIQSSKRIVISPSKETKLTQFEESLLLDLARERISHHTEFIVFKEPPKFKRVCAKEFSKQEAILFLTLKQIESKDDISLSLEGKLFSCKSNTYIWASLVEKSYSLTDLSNMSLRNTYKQKYGLVIENRVNPYYLILKELAGELISPTLTEEEKDEKVEVESI